jgi:hypothetical protein
MQQQQKHNNPPHREENDTTSRETAEQGIEDDAEKFVEEAQAEVAAARRPWYQTRRWGGTLLLFYIILILLFGFLAWGVYVHPVLAPDVTITKVFQENQSPWLRTTMVAVSAIGDIQVLSAGLVVFATVIFWLVDLRLEAIMIIVVSATSGILDALIVANHTPDSFRTVGGPCWSFACLPGSPLDKRCFGRLHVGWFCLGIWLWIYLYLKGKGILAP